MEEPQQHIKVEKKEIFIIGSLMAGVLMLMVLTSLRDARTRQKSQAQTPVEIGVQALSPLSEVELSTQSASVDLRSKNDNETQVLYDAAATGEAAVLEFMDKNPVIDVAALSNNAQVQGITTEGTKQRVLPSNFRKNSQLLRTHTSKTNIERKQIKRYYYTQKVKNIPVFGAEVRFDVEGEDKIVGVDGDYTLDETITEAKLTDEQALEIARKKAQDSLIESGSSQSVMVCSGQTPSRQILNKKLLGIGDDERNRLAFVVSFCNSPTEATFYRIYNIALDTGEVLSDANGILHVLNRSILNCNSSGCPVGRSEGSSPSGDAEVDQSYDILGEVYNYFFNTFGRDSYDNRGSTIKAKVHFKGEGQMRCPNAFWYPATEMMYACNGFVTKDIWAHELTHGITSKTSRLDPQGNIPLAGALNESISDMFAYALDPDWTLGEEKNMTIRDMSDPRRKGHPDRIFASNFSCRGEVHINAGPTNKAFYLMVEGGTFNGCTLNGVGSEKALAIIYKTNTEYLRSSSGFFDFNNKVNQACGELYGASSAECSNVKAALQATELDQDRCGAGKSRSTPICAGGTQPTVGPSTQQPQATVAPTTQQTQPTVGANPTLPQGGSVIDPTAVPQAVPTAIQTSGGPSLQFNPSTLPTEVGATVQSDIIVRAGSQQIVAADARLEYDEDMLEIIDVIDGTFFDTVRKTSPAAGKMYVGGLVRDTSSPITGSGILAKVIFKVKANGQAKVSFACAPGVITTDSNIGTDYPITKDVIQCSNNIPATITAGKGITLDLALKFQGVGTALGRSGGSIPIQVGITGDSIQETLTQLVQFSSNNVGIINGTVSFPTAPAGNYCVFIKGPLHSRRKVCHTKPLEAQIGEYRRGNSTIPLAIGENELDFTGISMMSGDVDQNGVVNSFDLLSVYNSIGSTNPSAIDRCDVNYDGACGALDYGLIVSALTVKTDE